jgi:hypothetical protein
MRAIAIEIVPNEDANDRKSATRDDTTATNQAKCNTPSPVIDCNPDESLLRAADQLANFPNNGCEPIPWDYEPVSWDYEPEEPPLQPSAEDSAGEAEE